MVKKKMVKKKMTKFQKRNVIFTQENIEPLLKNCKLIFKKITSIYRQGYFEIMRFLVRVKVYYDFGYLNICF